MHKNNHEALNEWKQDKAEKILGVPTAGIPFTAIVCQKLAIPMLYYRKERKEHGVRKKIDRSNNRLYANTQLFEGVHKVFGGRIEI